MAITIATRCIASSLSAACKLSSSCSLAPALLTSSNKPKKMYRLFSPRCAGFGGRFPETSLLTPDVTPRWLLTARTIKNEQNFQSIIMPFMSTTDDAIASQQTAAESQPQYALIISKDAVFSGAYQLESIFLGFKPTFENCLFLVPEGKDSSSLSATWTRMAGLRAVFEPLAMAATPEELLKAVQALKLDVHLSGFSLVHERISKLRGARWPRLTLRGKLAEVLRGNSEEKTSSNDCGICSPRLVVVETSRGYLFGPVIFAPPSPNLHFRQVPHQWSAGLPPALAAVAVNIAASPGDKLLDPCCGSGTILFEAYRRGIHVTGSDIHLGILQLAEENLAHFGIHVSVNWGPTCPIDGFHNPRSCLPDSMRPQTLLATKPTPLTAVMGPTASLQRSGSDSSEVEPRQVAESGLLLSEAVGIVGVKLLVEDARQTQFVGQSVVTNLPFDRFIKVGDGVVEDILGRLRGRASKYVFFSGFPIDSLLRELGYTVAAQICCCPRNKRFLCVATF